MKQIFLIEETNLVSPTGGKEYIVNDFFKFWIEPEDFENQEITMDLDGHNFAEQNPKVMHAIIDSLIQRGLLSNTKSNRGQFIESLATMSRTERRKAIRKYEKINGGKFLLIK